MFQITGPALSRGGAAVLSPFAFALSRGEMMGVVGPNGAGKSTLLRAIAGLSAEHVPVTLDGARLGRAAIGHLPQAFSVHSALSVLDCVLLGRRERLGLRVPPDIIAEAEALLAQLGLARIADRPMTALSGGQQQRVLIAQRLFRQPALMLMDEPTSALDLHHQLSALSELRTYARAAGAAVIVALHDLTLAARFCDRILIVADGGCAQPDSPDKVLTRQTIEPNWTVEPEFLRCRDGAMVIVPHSLGQRRPAAK
ncbi:MAG: ABC transporter ATP-binding protein [Paracoccaceae bacterium]